MQSSSTLENNSSRIFKEKPPISAQVKHNKATEEHLTDYAALQFPWTYSKQDVTPRNQQWKTRNAPWRNTNTAKDIRKNPVMIKATIITEITKKNINSESTDNSHRSVHIISNCSTTLPCSWHFCLAKTTLRTLNCPPESYTSCEDYISQCRHNFSSIE